VNRQLPANTGISSDFLQGGVPAFRLIDDELCGVKKLIDEQLAGSCDEIGRLLGTFSSCSGKMLRPGLVLLAGASCGKITDKHIRIAAIVEIIHNATLLHDDVIDEGKRRRGKPTVNSLWGNESAVLLGDFLLSKVFEMCADLEPEVTGIIAGTAVRICEGELRQIVQRQNWQLSESEYIDIITEKSAALLSCCCYLGGLLAGANEAQAGLLSCFGLNAGIAFQITDDLLDVIGSESETGKTPGRDVEKNKLTLPVIHLLRVTDGPAPIRRSLSSIGAGLAEMLRSCGSLEYAHSRAQEFIGKAIAALDGLKESNAKEALIETVRFIGRRAI
jgi:octaprenyl-diphosphate synthase